MATKRRFKAHESTINRSLELVFDRMEVEDSEIINRTKNGVPTCTVRFIRVNKEYKFSCSKFEHPSDNFRAVQLAITTLWRIYEDYEVYKFEELFAGFRCIPSDSILIKQLPTGEFDPFAILGLERDCTIEEVKKAYRTLVKKVHPDVGGSDKKMQEVAQAKDEILELLNAE